VRIAFANSSRIWGGAEVMTRIFLLGLQARGHDVSLLCRPGSPFLPRLGAEVECFETLGGFDANPLAVTRSAHALRRWRAESLVTMTQKEPRTAGVAARLLGLPVLLRFPMDAGFRAGLRQRAFYGMVPTHYVANSQATRATMLRSAPWLPAAKIGVIYNGIDTERFARAQPAEPGLPPGALAVGFVGRFEERKGVRELMDAWPTVAAAVSNAYLLLVGEGGTLQREVMAWARSAERVVPLGFRDDVAPWMAAFEVLLVPSHFEGFGIVVAEAMAAGTPVVASRASNLPELLDDGVEGRLVPVRDAGALAATTLDLLRDAELRAKLGRAAQQRARRDFSVERMLDEYEALLGAIVGSAGQAGRRAHRLHERWSP
jgi:glycosyltransferase involved in cell wall biosynthesis